MTRLHQTLEECLQSYGYSIPDFKLNQVVRFNAPGKPKSNCSAWIRVFENGSAVFGSWITGEQIVYHPRGGVLTKSEKSKFNYEMQVQRKQYEIDQLDKYKKGSHLASEIFTALHPAPSDHLYLFMKRIKSHDAKVDVLGSLVIPVYGICDEFQGKIQSLQYIYKNGHKTFLKNAKMKGGYFTIQWIEGAPIVICEGFSTGATLAEYYNPSSSVICAFNAGNLLPVARYFRERYPMAEIIIAGDNDHQNEINTGRVKAIEAANYIAGDYCIPEFETHEKGSDWNDRYVLDIQSESDGRVL